MVGGNNRSTNNGVTKIKTERKEAISTATKFKIEFHLKGEYSSFIAGGEQKLSFLLLYCDFLVFHFY